MIQHMLLRGLKRLRPTDWGEGCPEGRPVPETYRCAAAACDSMPLSSLYPGEEGVVTCLEAAGQTGTAKLAGMGVLPGATLHLLQRYPAYVFRMGHAEMAVDEGLARRILVRRNGQRRAAEQVGR